MGPTLGRPVKRGSPHDYVVLGTITDVSELLRLLLNGGHKAKAGYIAGALRAMGRPKQADEIVSTMKSAGYDVLEKNPFEVRTTSQ